MAAPAPQILLYTDFGLEGPYRGQMHSVLAALAPACPVIDLMADVPVHDPRAGAYLLAALVPFIPPGSVVVGVVDPGVGSPEREPVVLEADGVWYVGPGNGLFAIVARRAAVCRWWRIEWRPQHLSASFHGRDLFAPVAARLARGEPPPAAAMPAPTCDWPDDLPCVVYVDHFGNAITGLRAAQLPANAAVGIAGRTVRHARTFADVPVGVPFWYENSHGLLEVAANRARAADLLGIELGAPVAISHVGGP